MKEYSLGEVIRIKHGFAFSGENITTQDNKIVLVTPGNFKIGGGFQEEKCKFFDGEIPDEYVLSPQSFIVTMTDLSKEIDTLGYSAIIPLKSDRTYLHNQRIGLVTLINDKFCEKYIYYLMQTHDYQRCIANTSTGATVHHTSPAKIYDYKFYAPPIETQRRIADILSAYDDLIENNRKQIKLLEEAAQRLYKEWFVDLRFPRWESTKIVDGVPEGWRMDLISSIIALLSGFAFKSDKFTDNGKYKIVTIKNVKDGLFDGDNVNHLSEIPPKMPPHCILNDGDILLSLTGNVGRVCLVNGFNYLLNQRVAKLHSSYHSFTYCLFRSKDMFDKMNTLAIGVAQQNLSPVKTGELQINVPAERLLQQFESVVEPMLQKIIILSNQIEKAIATRDRLLPKLMSGELEV